MSHQEEKDEDRLHLPVGYELKDLQDRPWILGETIDVGGCGEIYRVSLGSSKRPLAEPNRSIRAETNVEYAIKFPLKSNHYFNHECSKTWLLGSTNKIEEWMTKRKLKFLGMPRYVAFGKPIDGKSGFGFVMLERLGKDLHKLWEENGKRFSAKTVVNIAIQILDVLEYLHEDGLHVHNDIKPSNILVDPKCCDQVYLIDFGHSTWYLEIDCFSLNRVHKSNVPNPEDANYGTPEFTSRDAHLGRFSRRSDLEMLAYTMLKLSSGKLPWEAEAILVDREAIKAKKIK